MQSLDATRHVSLADEYSYPQSAQETVVEPQYLVIRLLSVQNRTFCTVLCGHIGLKSLGPLRNMKPRLPCQADLATKRIDLFIEAVLQEHNNDQYPRCLDLGS